MTESMKLEPFQREERYIVIKRKHLTALQERALRAHMNRLGIGTVECVVVESDWPEYETVWRMIEDRVTGRHQPQEREAVLKTMRWRPIAELADIYQQPIWIASPELIHGDANPLGIAEAYWQDTDGPQQGEWRTTTFDMCNDEWNTISLPKEAVTHFLIPEGPWSRDEAEGLERDALTTPAPAVSRDEMWTNLKY